MKKTVLFLCFIVFAGLLSPLVLQAGGKFEGVITYTVNLPDNSSGQNMPAMLPTSMILMAKIGFLRNEYKSGMGNIIAITDYTKKTSLTLMDMMGKKIAIKKSLEDIQKEMENQPKPKIQNLPDTKVIAGYNCKKAIVTVQSQGRNIEMEVWYTNELGNRDMNFGNSWYQEIDGMLMEFSIQQRQYTMKYTATSVEKKTVPDNMFEVPPDYQIMTQDELKNMFSGGQH